MREAIVHVGLPKTGTTAIQNNLYKNRTLLRNQHKILYPSIDANHTNSLAAIFLSDANNHVSIKLRGGGVESIDDIKNRYYSKYNAELNEDWWKVLVLSAEGISNMTPDALGGIKSWLSAHVESIKILFWCRHPVAHSKSAMQEWIKGGATLDSLFQNPPLPHFQGKLENMFYVFGRENVSIQSFEEAAASNSGIVGTFCRSIGLPDTVAAEIARTAKRENTSMSMTGARMLSALNEARPVLVDGARNPKRTHGDIPLFLRIEGPHFDIPSEVKNRIRELTMDDVSWLNRTFSTNLYLDVYKNLPLPGLNYQPPDDSERSLALLLSDMANSTIRRKDIMDQLLKLIRQSGIQTEPEIAQVPTVYVLNQRDRIPMLKRWGFRRWLRRLRPRNRT